MQQFIGTKIINAKPISRADDKIVPWLASQTDILANDWVIVE